MPFNIFCKHWTNLLQYQFPDHYSDFLRLFVQSEYLNWYILDLLYSVILAKKHEVDAVVLDSNKWSKWSKLLCFLRREHVEAKWEREITFAMELETAQP